MMHFPCPSPVKRIFQSSLIFFLLYKCLKFIIKKALYIYFLLDLVNTKVFLYKTNLVKIFIRESEDKKPIGIHQKLLTEHCQTCNW